LSQSLEDLFNYHRREEQARAVRFDEAPQVLAR
jgi:hypothetical protein